MYYPATARMRYFLQRAKGWWKPPESCWIAEWTPREATITEDQVLIVDFLLIYSLLLLLLVSLRDYAGAELSINILLWWLLLLALEVAKSFSRQECAQLIQSQLDRVNSGNV